MNLLSIDPGARYAGWALFISGSLSLCGLDREEPRADASLRVGKHELAFCGSVSDRVVARLSALTFGPINILCELPNMKDKRAKKIASSDLMLTAAMCGAFAGRLSANAACAFVEPSEWKGQVPKEVMHNRIRAKLKPYEQANLDRLALSKTNLSHVLDAIGIGLWGLWRI